ncbi:DUF892 family protein [Pseudomonas sp.]|uniref:DUF892 family protein n=1 Tax=Pseudomonas sp. TaxID=306 RepID=UPI0025E22F40|nr:DUF892 family protein [Pseudomonas sp.]
MSKTDTDPALLRTCIEDLYAGCRAFSKRYPSIARQAHDAQLRKLLEELVDHALERAEKLRGLKSTAEYPENLWMSGILDDADRDTQTIAHGRHLDLALIGGVRKAVVAEFVSIETAIALADATGEADVAKALQEGHERLGEFNERLAALLSKQA